MDDPELLMEVLEAREAIESAETEEEVEELMEGNSERVARTEETLAGLCDEGRWDEAREQAVRLRYWINIREALQAWEKGKPVVLVH